MRQHLVNEAIKAIGRQSSMTMQNNKAAGLTKIGGKWTDEGFQKADQEANLNGMDIVKLKRMMESSGMGLGGSYMGIGGV